MLCPSDGGPAQLSTKKTKNSSRRGGLKSTGKRQESATFLQHGFLNVAVQFLACCSAAILVKRCPLCSLKANAAVQFLQHNFAKIAAQLQFCACGMLQGRGLEGCGLGLADLKQQCVSGKP